MHAILWVVGNFCRFSNKMVIKEKKCILGRKEEVADLNTWFNVTDEREGKGQR